MSESESIVSQESAVEQENDQSPAPPALESAGVTPVELASQKPQENSAEGQSATGDPRPTVPAKSAVGQSQSQIDNRKSETSASPASAAKWELSEYVRQLSVPQHKALSLLAQGITIREAAKQIGIARQTLYRWVQSEPRFRAAYNAWQEEQRESCRGGLLKCAEKAVARVATMVEHDHRLAFQVLKELGLFKPAQGSQHTNPEFVEHEIQIKDLRDEYRLRRLHLLELLKKGGLSLPEAKAYLEEKRRPSAPSEDPWDDDE